MILNKSTSLLRIVLTVVMAAVTFCCMAATEDLATDTVKVSRHLPVKNRTPKSHVAPHTADTILFEQTDTIYETTNELLLAIGAVDEIPKDSSIVVVKKRLDYDEWETREVAFSPDPTRAVWMSALFPGLGQLYNRRYWKLPIVIGAYMGLGYATSWNNGMLNDYTKAYRDIMDNDPNTKSYMDFFPPTINEGDLDRTWLTNILQSRKNFYRRNRDLCIIAMVGVYLIAMVDAYVDASLSHFDISPGLSMDVSPAVFQDGRNVKPSVGMVWALNF